MSESPPPPPPPSGSEQGQPPKAPTHASARVPERVARGVSATGFLVYGGPNEFLVDFFQTISRPPQLGARVIMTPLVAEHFLGLLRENFGRFVNNYGFPPPFPKGAGDQPRTIQEIFDDVKISDDLLSGAYCNAFLIAHSPAEFCVDFITAFPPHNAVSARVYLAAPHLPRLIESLNGILTQFKRQQPPPPPPPHTPPSFSVGPDRPPPPPPPPPPNYGTAPGIPGFPSPPE